jgi:hypothetical protein
MVSNENPQKWLECAFSCMHSRRSEHNIPIFKAIIRNEIRWDDVLGTPQDTMTFVTEMLPGGICHRLSAVERQSLGEGARSSLRTAGHHFPPDAGVTSHSGPSPLPRPIYQSQSLETICIASKGPGACIQTPGWTESCMTLGKSLTVHVQIFIRKRCKRFEKNEQAMLLSPPLDLW